MQYVLVVRADPDLPYDGRPGELEEWIEEGVRRGMNLEGHRLRGPQDATTVRRKDAETVVADGPFAEVKEFVGGFDLIEADDLAAAVDYASRHPVARCGAIEVREVWAGYDERSR